MPSYNGAMLGIAVIVMLSGCQKTSAPHAVTGQDVEAAQQEATREVAEAKAEAAKDIKSAAKVSGSDSKVVSEAKVTGSYDVTMAKADGDHKVATEKCLTLQADRQDACKQQADADYEKTKAMAKAMRLAKQQ